MLAPIPPLVVLSVGAVMVLRLGGEEGHIASEWGDAGLALSAVAAVATSVMLHFVARGRSVPSPILVAVPALPWLMGSVGARIAGTLEPAIGDHVSPVAVQFTGAITTQTLGSLAGAGLLGASALGLALAAWAQRAPGRRARGAAVGLAAGLTLCVSAIAAAASSEVSGGVAFVAALVAIPALALAGASVGTDGRSGAIATTTAVVASLSVLAGACADDAAVRIEAFRAIAHSGPGVDRAVVYSAAVEAGAAHAALANGGFVVAVIAIAILAGWSVARARPTRAQRTRVLLVLLVAGSLVLPSVGALRPADELLIGALRASSPYWPGVALARTSASAAVPDDLLEVLVDDEGVAIDGSSVDDAPSLLERHAERMRAIAQRIPAHPFTGEIVVAADRDVRYGDLVALLRAARRAGFVAPVLVVESQDGAPAALAIAPTPEPIPDDIARIRIAIGPTDVAVTLPGGARERPIDARDHAALRRRLSRARSESAVETMVIVHAPADIAWADVASHVALVHAHFPTIVLEHD